MGWMGFEGLARAWTGPRDWIRLLLCKVSRCFTLVPLFYYPTYHHATQQVVTAMHFKYSTVQSAASVLCYPTLQRKMSPEHLLQQCPANLCLKRTKSDYCTGNPRQTFRFETIQLASCPIE